VPRVKRSEAETNLVESAGPEFLEALARGLRVIEAFGRDRRQLTLSDAARAVDLPRASVRRTLHTLVQLGYAETDGRLFKLTPRILTLASSYLLSNPLSEILQPAVERVSAEVKEACSCAVPDGDDVVMIAHASPNRLIAVSAQIGLRLPAAQTIASETFDLPEPFGPTTTATPGSSFTSTGSGNDLKPRSLMERRCTEPER